MVQDWTTKIKKVVSTSGSRETLSNMGYTVPASQAEDYTQQLENERKAWTERVKLSGFTATE